MSSYSGRVPFGRPKVPLLIAILSYFSAVPSWWPTRITVNRVSGALAHNGTTAFQWNGMRCATPTNPKIDNCDMISYGEQKEKEFKPFSMWSFITELANQALFWGRHIARFIKANVFFLYIPFFEKCNIVIKNVRKRTTPWTNRGFIKT